MRYYWLWVDIDGRGQRWRMTRWMLNGAVYFCDTDFHGSDEEFGKCQRVEVGVPLPMDANNFPATGGWVNE